MSDVATAKMGARQMRNQQIKDPKKKKMMKVKKNVIISQEVNEILRKVFVLESQKIQNLKSEQKKCFV